MSDYPHATVDDFRRQNTLCAGLTDEQIEPYVRHHSGGLIVLQSELGDDETANHHVKMHDSWGDDGKIVVHRYDVEGEDGDPIADQVTYHDDVEEAYRVFEAWVATKRYTQAVREALEFANGGLHKVVTVVHTFRVHPNLSDDSISWIVGNMSVQAEEPVIGYSDDMGLNEITCDSSHVTAHWSAQDLRKE